MADDIPTDRRFLIVQSGDRFISILEPVSMWDVAKLEYLLAAISTCTNINVSTLALAQIIINLHRGAFDIKLIADDIELFTSLFIGNMENERSASDLAILNRFTPTDAKFTDVDGRSSQPEWLKNLTAPSSGDWLMDNLADLTSILGSYDQALSMVKELTASQINHFIYRHTENAVPREKRIDAAQHEWFDEQMMQDPEFADEIERISKPEPPPTRI
jgi:hypothetical protein